MVDITKKSQSRAAGDLVFLSGRTGIDGNMQVVPGGVAAQTRASLEHLENTLREHELDRSHIVKTHVFITDRAYFSEFNRVYSEFFEGLEYPARRTVVAELVLEDAVIEIDAVACRG